MKRSLRKAVAFSCAVAMTAMFMLPGTAAGSTAGTLSQAILDNTYDAAVEWNNGALYIKNGSVNSITDQTEMVVVKLDGSVSNLSNLKKFDKIYYSTSGSYYTSDSNYLIVGKDGKKAILKEDGSFLNDTLYDDVLSVTDHYMAVMENGKCAVRKLDSTLVKEYSGQSSSNAKYSINNIRLYETANSLIVSSYGGVLDIFDKNLNEIDISDYDNVIFDYYYSDSIIPYLCVRLDGYMGIISDTGKEIVPPDYDNVHPFSYNGVQYFAAFTYTDEADAKLKMQDFTVYKEDGTVLLTLDYGSISTGYLSENGGYAPFYNGSKWGIYDFNKDTVKVQPVYDSIEACNGHCFVYQLNDKVGIKTYDNKDIIESGKYDAKQSNFQLSDDRIVINVGSQGSSGEVVPHYTVYIYDSNTGKLILTTDKYNLVEGYSNRTAEGIIVRGNTINDYTCSILDESGNEIFSVNGILLRCYDSYYNLPKEAKNLWLMMKDNKLGIVDSRGRTVIDTEYQSIGNCGVKEYTLNHFFLFGNKIRNSKTVYTVTEKDNKFGLMKLNLMTAASGLSLDKTDASLKIGEMATLTPKFTPADTSDQTATWSSSDETIATVKDGVVTALKPGTVTITATSEDGGLIATCTVQVTEAANPTTTTSTTSSTDTAKTGSTDSTQNNTNPIITSETVKSPATGESPVAAGTALILLAASALATGFTLKKK